MKTNHVIIIGGGLAGLALSLFLKKAGIKSTIYEAYPRLTNIGGGLTIAPNGMNVLAELGLKEKLLQKGGIVKEFAFINQQGIYLAGIKIDEKKYGQPSVPITRSDLHEILTNAAEEQGITIYYQKRLKGIDDNGLTVTAHFEDGSVSEGDILIGADGLRSATRSITFPDAPSPSYTGFWGIGGFIDKSATVSLTEKEKDVMMLTFGQNGFFGHGMINKDHLGWWCHIEGEEETTRNETFSMTDARIKEILLEKYTGYHPRVIELITKTTSYTKTLIYDIPSLPVWHKGRVLLVGDAAHAVSPGSGLGASLAFEDTIYLAKLLRDEDDYALAFQLFQQERKPRVEKVIATTRRGSNQKKAANPLSAWIREKMMAFFISQFGAKSFNWQYGYKVNWK